MVVVFVYDRCVLFVSTSFLELVQEGYIKRNLSFHVVPEYEY